MLDALSAVDSLRDWPARFPCWPFVPDSIFSGFFNIEDPELEIKLNLSDTNGYQRPDNDSLLRCDLLPLLSQCGQILHQGIQTVLVALLIVQVAGLEQIFQRRLIVPQIGKG